MIQCITKHNEESAGTDMQLYSKQEVSNFNWTLKALTEKVGSN